jgi:hypothetical protein
MIYLIASLIVVGAALFGWAQWMGRGSYNADGNMWLIAPDLLGLALIAAGVILALGWGASRLFHH